MRNINVRVQEILLISYSYSILLTEGDRGLRKSFILQELCHVNRNEKGFLIFFQVFGVNEITPFCYMGNDKKKNQKVFLHSSIFITNFAN